MPAGEKTPNTKPGENSVNGFGCQSSLASVSCSSLLSSFLVKLSPSALLLVYMQNFVLSQNNNFCFSGALSSVILSSITSQSFALLERTPLSTEHIQQSSGSSGHQCKSTYGYFNFSPVPPCSSPQKCYYWCVCNFLNFWTRSSYRRKAQRQMKTDFCLPLKEEAELTHNLLDISS